MPNYDTSNPAQGNPEYTASFYRDNGPTIPSDPIVIHMTGLEGSSPQPVLDFIQDVIDNTGWVYVSGSRTYPVTEQIV